jgi:hypothetical protein
MQTETRRSAAEEAARAVDTMAEAPFYIFSASPSARPRRTLDAFSVQIRYASLLAAPAAAKRSHFDGPALDHSLLASIG